MTTSDRMQPVSLMMAAALLLAAAPGLAGAVADPVWLGVLLADVPQDAADRLGLGPAGVLVVAVTTGSPAHKAGIRTGDIVVSVAGRDLATPADLRPLLAQMAPGQRIAIALLRPGRDGAQAARLRTRASLERPPKPAEDQGLRDMVTAAEQAMKDGRHAEAEAQFARALEDFQGPVVMRARLHVLRGMAAAKQGKVRIALNDFNRALELNPKESRAYYSRGLARGKLEQYDRAVADFTEAIRLAPRDALARYYRGSTYLRLNRPRLAIADFEAALKLRPGDTRLQKTLAAARRQLAAPLPSPPAPADEAISD
jgi:tetratricopeptide (TPR) repeat protein